MTAGAEETKTLYKCVDAKGMVSIQAKTCPAGSAQAWVRPAQTEPKQTAAEVQAAHDRERKNQQQVRDLSEEVNRKLAAQTTPEPAPAPAHLQMAGPQPAPPETPDPGELQSAVTSQCRQAQSFMAAAREKTWIGFTDDQMKRIYGWVMDQCRVNTASTPR
jgi:hypothetical protein